MGIGQRSNDLRDDSRLAVQLQPLVIHPAGNAPVKQQERFVGYIFQSQLRILRQRMLSGQDDEKPFLKKDFRLKVCQINRRAQESNIDLQFAERFILARGYDVLTLNFSSGKTFQVFRHCLIDFLAKPRGNSDLHQTGFAPLSESSSIDGMLCLGKQLSCFLQENMARTRQLYAALVADEELNARFLFQLMNLLA